MAATTVTGAFTILDRASRPIRRIREEATKTDAVVKRLGANLDRIGTREQRQSMGQVAGQLRKVAKEGGNAAAATERARKGLDKVGAPAVAQNVSRTAQAVANVDKAATEANPPVSELSEGVRQLDTNTTSASGALRKFAGTALGLRQALMIGLIPMIGLAVQGIGALAVGVTALLPKLTSFLSVAAPLGTGILGLGTAAITAKLAFKDLGDAINGDWDDMKKLTPQARELVRTLRQYKPVIDGLRRSAQQGLFPGIDLAVRRLAKGVPVANQMLRSMGAALGGVAARGAGWATRGGFMNDLQMLTGQGGTLLSRGASALMNIGDALRHVLVAAMPFTDWLSRTVVGWTRGWKEAARLGRETGKLGDWFDRARADLEQFGRITSNVWNTLKGVGRAIRPLGESLWRSIERVTSRWERFTNSARGQGDMRRYFSQMRVPLQEITGLTGDLVESLGRLSAGRGLVSSVRALRSALPALERGLGAMAEAFGPAVVGALAQVVRLFGNLAADAGPLTSVVRLFGNVVGSINWLIEHIPGLGTAFAAALTVGMVTRFAGALQGLAAKWLGVAGAARTAAAAQAAAGGAGGARGAGSLLPMMLPGARGRVARRAAGPGALRGAAGGALRGAGKLAWPVALGMGAFDALGTAGTLGERGQAALSGATFGLINRPTLGAEARQQGADRASTLAAGGDVGAMRARVDELRSRLTARDEFTDPGFAGRGGGRVSRLAVTGKDRVRLQSELDKLQPELKVAVKIERQQAVREAKSSAQQLAAGLGQAFNIYDRRVGMRRAMEMTTHDVTQRMKGMGPVGRRALATNMLSWAREQARQNPKLVGEVARMERRIERQFSRLGQHVDVVNGAIVTGSKKDWDRIAGNLERPAERARQRVSAEFTRMQEIAVSQLVMMGFSRGDARRIVRGQERGGAAGRNARWQAGNVDAPAASTNMVTQFPNKRARGGRIHGMGLQDNVMVAPGHLAAPGELIVNRHTERRLDNYLGAFGTSLGREVAGERRRHDAPHERYAAKGGRVGDLSIVSLGRMLQRQGYAVGEHPAFGGVQGGHATNSWHYRAGAIDVNADNFAGGEARALDAIAGRIRQMGFNVLWRVADHFDHLHADIGGGGGTQTMGRGGALAGLGAGMPRVKIGRRRTGVGGVAGVMGDTLLERGRRGLVSSLNERVGSGGMGMGGGGGGDLDGWLTRALQITGLYSPRNLALLRGRAMQESGGNPLAINNWDSNAKAGTPSIGLLQTIGPTFDAYKMGGMGNIRNPVHNAVAALRYMMDRYGHVVGPSGSGYAMGGRIPFGGWYGKGGSKRFNTPTMIGVGDGGAEDVTVTPVSAGRRGGSAGINITFAPGSIVVQGGSAEAGQAVADAVMERITKAIREAGMEHEGAMA
jgi:hypothetical protein